MKLNFSSCVFKAPHTLSSLWLGATVYIMGMLAQYRGLWINDIRS